MVYFKQKPLTVPPFASNCRWGSFATDVSGSMLGLLAVGAAPALAFEYPCLRLDAAEEDEGVLGRAAEGDGLRRLEHSDHEREEVAHDRRVEYDHDALNRRVPRFLRLVRLAETELAERHGRPATAPEVIHDNKGLRRRHEGEHVIDHPLAVCHGHFGWAVAFAVRLNGQQREGERSTRLDGHIEEGQVERRHEVHDIICIWD